jgi:hypothetical protein
LYCRAGGHEWKYWARYVYLMLLSGALVAEASSGEASVVV